MNIDLRESRRKTLSVLFFFNRERLTIQNLKDYCKYQILVLEDSPSAMNYLIDVLSDFIPAENIHQAFNYDEAAQAVSKQCIDLIFSDLHMPNLNGMDFIVDFLGKDLELRNIPVVVTTGVTEKSLVKAALENHVYRYLQKPVSADQVRDVLIELSNE